MNQIRYRIVLVRSAALFLLLSAVRRLAWRRKYHSKGIRGPWMAAFAAEDGRVITASSDQTAKLWDAVTGAELQTFTSAYRAVVLSGRQR